MSEKKREILDNNQMEIVSSNVLPALKIYDFKEWQEVCKSFAPPHYAKMTRKMWFRDNEWRLTTAREIVEFIEGWTQTFRESSDFENVTKNSIRKAIIDIVRIEQERQYSTKGRVNAVKLSGFKTLVKWADKPCLLKKGPYKGKSSIPEGEVIVRKQRKTGRKSIKGKFRPPDIDLSANPIINRKGYMTLKIAMINNYIHPYQNVDLQLDLSEGIKIESISPFGWSPQEQKVIIGFLPASLDTEPMLTKILIEFVTTKKEDRYVISPTIHFDNTDKGMRETAKCEEREIRI